VAGTLVKFEGTPWINAISFTGSSLVFNGTDNRFHAVLNGGADGLSQAAARQSGATRRIALKAVGSHSRIASSTPTPRRWLKRGRGRLGVQRGEPWPAADAVPPGIRPPRRRSACRG
jgi:hypothetical protein